jgi:hypothetical protein
MKQLAPVLTLIATALFLLSPFVTPPFTGFDPTRFPVPQVNPPVQPAGYAFAIWGLIYLWLAVLAVTGATSRRADPVWTGIHLPLTLSLGPGALWLWVAGFAPITASVLILWMLGCALWALARAPQTDRWLLQAPIAIYAGWLTAAAHVSAGVVLGGYGWLSSEAAALLALASALGVTLVVLRARPQAPEYGLTVIWALVGVMVGNLDGSILVFWAAGAALTAIAALLLWRALTGQRARAL